MAQIRNQEYYGQDRKDFVVNLVNQGVSVTEATRQMCDNFNLSYRETVGRKYRDYCQQKNVTKTLEQELEYQKAKKRTFDNKKKRFIISWAQSETAIHEEFLINIEAYANKIDAEIHIIAGRYSNPTSLKKSNKLKSKEKNKQLWDSSIQKYLCASRLNLHEHLTVLGELKIHPTAHNPLSGLNGITGLESCVIGHPKVSLTSLPILNGYPNKFLLTTGAITVANYTDTKAGAKGLFHHTLGFVIVELDGDVFHIRQVQADDCGNFYDLFYAVIGGKVSEFGGCPAIVFGDLHIGNEDREAVDLAFEVADRLQPEEIVLHDLMDSYSINHHELKLPFVLLDKEDKGQLNLEQELENIFNWLKEYEHYNFVVVESNHNDFLSRWLNNTDWRKSPNKKLYLKLSNMLAENGLGKGAFQLLLEQETDNTTTLSYDDSYRIGEWEVSRHGDYGNAGSRGSSLQFSNLNTKTITGHTHTPHRHLGHIAVGTLTKLKMGYNVGLSSWYLGIVIIYPNNKASHVHFTKGKYTTLK